MTHESLQQIRADGPTRETTPGQTAPASYLAYPLSCWSPLTQRVIGTAYPWLENLYHFLQTDTTNEPVWNPTLQTCSVIIIIIIIIIVAFTK